MSRNQTLTEDDKMYDTIAKEGRPDLCQVLKRFCEKTSMHGCGQIESSLNIASRLIWTVLTLAGVCTLSVHLYWLIDEFDDFPKTTKVSLGFSNLRFPAVTVCNVNTLKKELLGQYGSGELNTLLESVDPKQLMQQQHNMNEDSTLNTSKEMSGTTGNASLSREKRFTDNIEKLNLSQFDPDILSTGYDDNEELWDTAYDPTAKLKEVFRYLYMSMTRKDREEAGHSMSDMLISCSFNERSCFARNFTLYQTSSYGNCYTLDSPNMVVRRPGPIDGLTLNLFLETDQFIPGLTNGYGIRLVVHAPGTIPQPNDDGVFISSASETTVSLRQTSISREGSPYGDCNDGEEFKRTIGFTYSIQACYEVCQVTNIHNACNCSDFMHERVAIRRNKTFKLCKSIKERKCMNKIITKMKRKEINCECYNPCSETKYSMSISSRQWPTDTYAMLLKQGVCELKPESCDKLSALTDFRKIANNFAKLNIYYETLNYEQIVEEPKIEFFQLLSSIGGALGLWIGLSMLGLCEVLQLVVEVTSYFVNRCRDTAHR